MKGTQTVITSPKDGSERVCNIHSINAILCGDILLQVFNFDHSFWSAVSTDDHFATQEHVFTCLGKGVLDNAFDGYNACILAYGQTGG